MCTTVSYFLPHGSLSFSYTGLFFTFWEKNWGGTGPPGPSPCYGTAYNGGQSKVGDWDVAGGSGELVLGKLEFAADVLMSAGEIMA